MTAKGYEHFNIDGIDYELLMIDLTLDKRMNCELFNSCKKTKYATQVPAMGNAIGFTTFQGTEAYRRSPVFINMSYADQGLNFTIDPCDYKNENKTLRGFRITEFCKCNSCDKACQFDINDSLPVMEGFSWLVVGFTYLFVLLASLLIYLCKCYYRKKHPYDHSRSSSLDSLENTQVHAINRVNPNNMANQKNNLDYTTLVDNTENN